MKIYFIPKLLWSEREARYLTFLEEANPPFYIVELVSTLNSLGVKLVDNTPEEINDLVLEMLDRLDGTFEYTEEDKSLHQQFSNLLSSSSQFSCGTNSRIGRNFLRKYKNLLLSLEENKKLE
ncbi:TIGR04372 family glycosyltransferase [bacterium]|nr:TIGR04372 family glycosyltransferase [bacterium]